MPTNPYILYTLSGILAFIPAFIWLTVLYKKTKRKGIQTLIFLVSIFSVVPVLLLYDILKEHPQYSILGFIKNNVSSFNVFGIVFTKAIIIAIFSNISVGIVEEIAKQILVRVTDYKYLLIQTINESLQFSLISALGFAFAENILYFYNIYTTQGPQVLMTAIPLRSIFTTCLHLVCSGFLGYYYGIAKFSLNIVEEEKWLGKKQRMINFVSSLFGMSKTQSFKEVTILKGLAIAILIHAAYDFFMGYNTPISKLLALSLIIITAIILFVKLSRKTGQLILVTDVDAQRASSMATKDEDVVIELLGMWFKEKRYVDVIHICQRLLQRDPDNKVVQLFKANAIDKIEGDSAYEKILKNLFPEKQTVQQQQKTLEELAAEKKPEKPIVLPKPTTPQPTPAIPEKEEEKTFKLNI